MPPKAIFRVMNRAHIALYRATGGRVLGKIAGSPVLILTTTGRKTGQPRTTPLVYAPDGARFCVIASDHPGWYINLKAHPQATIEIKGQTYTVTARDADETESDWLWELLIRQSPAFASFKGKRGHQLVVLSLADQNIR
jgi:deazaflavin-dependent oxidoreductase (nitroreductase family)